MITEQLNIDLENIYLSIQQTNFSDCDSLCRENNFGDLIFNLIGDLLDDNKFEEVDYILKIADLNKLEPYSIVCFLSITHPYDRSKLKNWNSFCKNCKAHLLKTETIDRVERLLKGFSDDILTDNVKWLYADKIY